LKTILRRYWSVRYGGREFAVIAALYVHIPLHDAQAAYAMLLIGSRILLRIALRFCARAGGSIGKRLTGVLGDNWILSP
jgi:hypothetical protein